MHILSLIWNVLIFMAIVLLFSDESIIRDILYTSLIVLASIVLLPIAVVFFINYKKKPKINTPEERKKQEQLLKIREWSRRNRC